jgi:N-acetylglucosaminyldiphosphoundecaprenol N-acetyl-beta-D-mannosaminyltransferase
MMERRLETRPVFGIPIADLSMGDALDLCVDAMRAPPSRTRSLFFVNAHTLNLAYDDRAYRAVLDASDWVFGDGTGVRWAVRFLHGARLRDNVNGTDLVPALLGRELGLRYYLLGASAGAIERAAAHARVAFPGWQLVGHHDGYVEIEGCDALVEKINASRPHLLLVGMGNPKQERWIHAQRERLAVPLCLGIGGLLDYWAGDLERAPRWMRRIGFEWLHLLIAQPRKFRRYVLGNPLFLLRLAREKWLGRRA